MRMSVPGFAAAFAVSALTATPIGGTSDRFALLAQDGPRWTVQESGVTARFRGISVVSDTVVWASGANGTIVRTIDGGKTWRTITPPPDTQKLDFRDVDAIDTDTAYILSIGPGEASRIFKTKDGGRSWVTQFVNRDEKAFFDAMVFWNERRGVAVSDSIDGRFVLLVTENGGDTWTPVAAEGLPPALPNEGAFAASGTNLTVPVTLAAARFAPASRDASGGEASRPKNTKGAADAWNASVAARHVWLGAGAAATARVLRSRDGGRSWKVAATPLPAGPSAGIFSVTFRDTQHGVIVGGDYKNEAGAVDNVAISSDGGATWTVPKSNGLSGFRSVVAYQPHMNSRTLVAVGPSGADVSMDDGRNWRPIPSATGESAAASGLHTFGFAPGGQVGWGAGEKGRIARLDMP
jgi:photosystem II stability/assembly factor-like uncharacterized protein